MMEYIMGICMFWEIYMFSIRKSICLGKFSMDNVGHKFFHFFFYKFYVWDIYREKIDAIYIMGISR